MAITSKKKKKEGGAGDKVETSSRHIAKKLYFV
jgi:hypothetical protein